MASARLRKAFRYPDDSADDDDAREELDEEEQERVIKHLKMQDDKRNSEYRVIFTVIPLVSIIVFLPSLLSSAAQGFSIWLLSLLSILSLLATAYTMKYIPPQRPDPKGKKPMRNPDFTMHLQRLLVPGNAVVCGILVLVYLFSSAGLSSYVQPVLYLVPPALLATTLIVHQVMLSVDLKALEGLRYEYKGA